MDTQASMESFNAGDSLLRDVWGVVSVSLLAVILRVFAKLRTNQFRPDDIIMSAAQLLFIIGAACITVGVEKGFGHHVWDIPRSTVSEVIKFDYLSQALGIAASCLGRVAFIVYLVGVLRSSGTQRTLWWWLLGGTQIITNIMSLLIMFLQCPGQGSAIWDQTGKQQCWDIRVQAYYAYFQGAINSATDLALAVYPTHIFWNLNMATRTKAGLMVLMGLGVFAMIASIIKTTQARVLAYPDNDPTVATIRMDRWLYIETALVITTASIPCIRSLIVILKRKNSENRSVSYELRSRHGVSTSAICESRYKTSKVADNGRKLMGDNNSSEDNILSSEEYGNQGVLDEGRIVRRIDISVSVEPSVVHPETTKC